MTTAWGVSAFAATDCGAPVAAPKHQAGENWTWRDEVGGELSEVVQAEGDLIQMKWPNGDVAFHDKDLLIRMISRPNGQVITKQGAGVYTAVGVKTIDFPLQVGKEWKYGFFAQVAQTARGIMAPRWHSYEVVGCEEVTTPAGTFPAFKLEATEFVGDRSQSSAGQTFSFGMYHVWYAPQVRNFVKRHYVHSSLWSGPAFRDYELIKFEVK